MAKPAECMTCPFWAYEEVQEPTCDVDDGDIRNAPPRKDLAKWHKDNDGYWRSQCRRMPPKPGDEGRDGEWPLTAAFDWCGEHPAFPRTLKPV